MDEKEAKVKSFKGFKEWLILNERQKENRADVIISNLRTLEDLIKDEFAGENRIGKLHSFYRYLEEANDYKARERNRLIGSIKKKLAKAFQILVSESKRKDVMPEYTRSEVNGFKTAYLLYLKFLGEMTDSFTLDSLEEEGIIRRQRKRNGKVPESERISPVLFKKGIVGLMRKMGVFAEGDYSSIVCQLNKMSEIMDAYALLHGGKLSNVMMTCSFLTTAKDNVMESAWQAVLANNNNIRVNGSPIMDDNVVDVEVDELSSRLILYNSNGSKNAIPLPVISGRRAGNRILSVRIYPTATLERQFGILNEIRSYCNRMRRFTNAISLPSKKRKMYVDSDLVPWTEGVERSQEMIVEVISEIDLIMGAAFEAIQEYASCFIIELVLE